MRSCAFMRLCIVQRYNLHDECSFICDGLKLGEIGLVINGHRLEPF